MMDDKFKDYKFIPVLIQTNNLETDIEILNISFLLNKKMEIVKNWKDLIYTISNSIQKSIIYIYDLDFYIFQLFAYSDEINFKIDNNKSIISKEKIFKLVIKVDDSEITFIDLKKIYTMSIDSIKQHFHIRGNSFNSEFKVIEKLTAEQEKLVKKENKLFTTIGNIAVREYEKSTKDIYTDDKKVKHYYNAHLNNQFEPKLYELYAKAYYGGLVSVNEKYKDKQIGAGIFIDENSIYPAKMKESLPFTSQIKKFDSLEQAKKYKFYIVELFVISLKLKTNGIPVFPKKNSYIDSKTIKTEKDLAIRKVVLTNIDFEMIEKEYDFKYKIINIFGWRTQEDDAHKRFIDKLEKEKEQATVNNDKFTEKYTKNKLNIIVGKLGQGKVANSQTLEIEDNNVYYSDSFSKIETNKKGLIQSNDIVHAIFITAKARKADYDAIVKVRNDPKLDWVYTDTDSLAIIFLDEKEKKEYLNSIENNNLIEFTKKVLNRLEISYSENIFGKWKIQNNFIDAKFIKAKTYALKLDNETTKITLSGIRKGTGTKLINDEIIKGNWNYFSEGLKVETETIKKVKHGKMFMKTERVI